MNAAAGERLVLQGNAACALGVLHGGFHAADGYPGTPSTEVMEYLQSVPDAIAAGWSVNEAVAVGVAVGRSMAGHDVLVTMKVPGVMQAGDVIASAAATGLLGGALVFFVATDHAPSSTQYVLDTRSLWASLHIPVLEPRDHQDLYTMPCSAADISRRYQTPVVVLASSVLCHSEGMVTLGPRRTLTLQAGSARAGKVLLPADALHAWRQAKLVRMPRLQQEPAFAAFTEEIPGSEPYGIIATGEASMIVREAIAGREEQPSLLLLGVTHPLLLDRIRSFCNEQKGPLYLFEDGDRFVQDALNRSGIYPAGKDGECTITHWDPESVRNVLGLPVARANQGDCSLRRPPAICPGCPYRATGVVLRELKKLGRISHIFGDIGCSTLLYFDGALDVNLCMGASESMRQGYVLAHPDAAGRVVSLIGDSSECHSGLDSTRNAVYRKIPGVKIVLDNRTIAMTGGQASPTTLESGDRGTFDLARVLEAEGPRSETLDAYDPDSIRTSIINALKRAEEGDQIALVIRGSCIQAARSTPHKRQTRLMVDDDRCLRCGECRVCPAVECDADGALPRIGALCNRCGDGRELCVTLCPAGGIVEVPAVLPGTHSVVTAAKTVSPEKFSLDFNQEFPDALRIGICGVGGQGNLFFGKVLAQVMQQTPFAAGQILKGEVHGMAQKGGAVWSSFACGRVHAPLFANGTMDFLIAMERNELLRPEYLSLLKPDGIILINDYSITPAGMHPEAVPSLSRVLECCSAFRTLLLSASESVGTRAANSYMLGALSALPPFTEIEPVIWLEVLQRVSGNEGAARSNREAFSAGSERVEELLPVPVAIDYRLFETGKRSEIKQTFRKGVST